MLASTKIFFVTWPKIFYNEIIFLIKEKERVIVSFAENSPCKLVYTSFFLMCGL